MQPTWLADLGLTPLAEGVWRHEATGLCVDMRITPDELRLSGTVCKVLFLVGEDDYAYVLCVSTRTDGMAIVRHPMGARLPADARRFAVALNLAADLAEAFTAHREATDAHA